MVRYVLAIQFWEILKLRSWDGLVNTQGILIRAKDRPQ